ncbi:hypothetical protein ACL7TT_10180 [Microbulbifer sp. 2304DJ12-6]|uniref:hypothetical protein n=1 Tax=Microbulbifer sp. 2304DJ12-6 TaxID=3233340 RepID=UPI00261464F9|nr:hypothetical protein [uncultured Microbulbifer sp.]
MKSTIVQKIRILKGGWRVADREDDIKYVKQLEIELLIEGNAKNGYHLIMTPEGFFAADLHFDSIEEAKEEAEEYFEVSNIQWS